MQEPVNQSTIGFNSDTVRPDEERLSRTASGRKAQQNCSPFEELEIENQDFEGTFFFREALGILFPEDMSC